MTADDGLAAGATAKKSLTPNVAACTTASPNPISVKSDGRKADAPAAAPTVISLRREINCITCLHHCAKQDITGALSFWMLRITTKHRRPARKQLLHLLVHTVGGTYGIGSVELGGVGFFTSLLMIDWSVGVITPVPVSVVAPIAELQFVQSVSVFMPWPASFAPDFLKSVGDESVDEGMYEIAFDT